MVIKSFNVESETYEKFSLYCKKAGLSMSKQIDFFMKSVVGNNKKIRDEYAEKLDNIRKQESIRVGAVSDFKKKYGIK